MKPQDAVTRAETIFDEMAANVIAQFEQASNAETWEQVLSTLREIARLVGVGGSSLAGYAGVAARQMKREEAATDGKHISGII